MNKRNSKQRKSIGKESPLSKRPKLDFTIRTRESFEDSSNWHNGSNKEKITASKSFEDKLNKNLPAASDWDEDFSGDMLEKVCLIADLSQAMVNNRNGSDDQVKEKNELEMIEAKRLTPKEQEKSRSLSLLKETGQVGNINQELDRLKLEYEKLLEKFKTKEGEVHILRSQLKQNEDAKQSVILQNIKVLEEIQKKFNEKFNLTEKELETTKTKLQFKDMEYKTLSERCRQLEYNLSKSKLGECHDETKTVCAKMSQEKELEVENKLSVVDSCKNLCYSELTFLVYHKGKFFSKIVSPELFKLIEEPSVVPFYTFCSGLDDRKLNFDKKTKYKWSNLPQQDIFIKDLYNSVSSLFTYESFTKKEAKATIKEIFESCQKILCHNKKLLLFLEELQLDNREYDNSDQSLLENEETVKTVTIKNLLDDIRLNKEECGIEGRRSLALIYSLMKTSQVATNMIKDNVSFFKLLLALATSIGNLRRPLRYTGVLVGMTFILQRILEERILQNDILVLINEIVEEIIFARPKLDVLKEVVNILAAGKHHLKFLATLCRKAPVGSRSLFRDSKLKQAMLFTKNACPLILLCMQLMGLAGLPSNQYIRWDLTNGIIKWLNNSINTPDPTSIKWLPVNSEDRCFNVTECLLYLLSLCLRDYNICFLTQDTESSSPDFVKSECDIKKNSLVSIIGHGVVLLKRILKADQKQLHDNTYFLRFAVLLKALIPSKSDLCHKNHMSEMSSVQMEAISWITDSLECGLRNQDFFLKQNTSTLPDVDVFNALKINDESKMY